MQEAADEATVQLRKNELLILAASTGFISDVENLISDGADVNCKDKEGTPLLHFPAGKNKLDVVKLLLSKGVDIDSEDASGQTALHFAAQSDSSEVVKHLAKSGAWIDCYDSNDDTPLHLAIRNGNSDSVKALLMAGAKTEIMNNRKLTALGEAITAKNVELVRMLIDKGADVQRILKGFSLLHLAAGVGSVEILKVVLDHLKPQTVVNPSGVTPLHCAAARSPKLEVIKLLLDNGSDRHTADDDGRLPVDWAREDGKASEEVLKLLSVGDRKRSRHRHKSSVVTEIEPADGPEAEWESFQTMSYPNKLKQVEVWARSKEQYLNSLSFLDSDARRAVALVGNFMRMLECRVAVERLKTDEDFQNDAVDPQVQRAVAECTENPQLIRKYQQDEKVMSVLVKLKRLQEVLKRNGRMKVVYEELLESTEGRRTLSEEQEMSIEELEKTLQTAKEAVVKSVMGGNSANKKTEETYSWWGADASPSTKSDGQGEDSDSKSGSFLRAMVFQFLRQFVFALVMLAALIFGMYLTDSLPVHNPEQDTVSPALLPVGLDVHQRFADFNQEL